MSEWLASYSIFSKISSSLGVIIFSWLVRGLRVRWPWSAKHKGKRETTTTNQKTQQQKRKYNDINQNGKGRYPRETWIVAHWTGGGRSFKPEGLCFQNMSAVSDNARAAIKKYFDANIPSFMLLYLLMLTKRSQKILTRCY